MGYFSERLKTRFQEKKSTSREMYENLVKHLETTTPEELERDLEQITHTKFYKRWVDKFHKLSKDKRLSIIDKIKKKYESFEYVNTEYQKGFEPRCPLYDILWEYAEEYGTHFVPKMYNYFPSSYYLIDDEYIIRLMNGQGTVIDVFTKKEFEKFIKYAKTLLL